MRILHSTCPKAEEITYLTGSPSVRNSFGDIVQRCNSRCRSRGLPSSPPRTGLYVVVLMVHPRVLMNNLFSDFLIDNVLFQIKLSFVIIYGEF